MVLIDIASYLIWILQRIIIVQFVLSLLISFNVVNLHNDYVAAFWRGLNMLLEPLYRPIRKALPDTGAIDFSPMVLLILLQIIGGAVLPAIAGSIGG